MKEKEKKEEKANGIIIVLVKRSINVKKIHRGFKRSKKAWNAKAEIESAQKSCARCIRDMKKKKTYF